MPIPRPPAATAVLALFACLAAAPIGAESPAAGQRLRIVPAVRYGVVRAERGDGSLAPRVRPLLAWYQDEAPAGSLAMAYTSEPRDSFPTELRDPAGRILARGASFRWGTGWVSLIGIPSTARPGACELEMPGIRLPFRVTARVFASETIPLTSTLTALRAQPDPRKAAEAVELAALLAGSNPEAMHETGAFLLPLAKIRRTAGYGDRRVYRYDDGSAATSVHAGVDLAMPEGTPVASCGAGRVVMAKERVITGGTVVVEHLPGLFSLYCHLSAISVREGDLLAKGQTLGLVGKTGLATGAHLHWEVVVGGVAVDPDLLTGGLPFAPGRWPVPELPAAPVAAPPAGPAPAPNPVAATPAAEPTPAPVPAEP